MLAGGWVFAMSWLSVGRWVFSESIGDGVSEGGWTLAGVVFAGSWVLSGQSRLLVVASESQLGDTPLLEQSSSESREERKYLQ